MTTPLTLYTLNYVHEDDDKLRDRIWNQPQLFRSAEAAKQAAQDDYAEFRKELVEDDASQAAEWVEQLVWEQDEPGQWYACYGGTHITVQTATVQED